MNNKTYEELIEQIFNLLGKWLKDRQKLINKAEHAITTERRFELICKIDQSKIMYEELWDIVKTDKN